MDVSNLRSNYPKLLAYLAENRYGKAHTNWIKRCINLVLTDGASCEIESYEQLYWFEVEKCGYTVETTRKTFKSTLGTVWRIFVTFVAKSSRNYQYLRSDEAAKLRMVIHNEHASCDLLAKAIVAIAYYTGMRGTDIKALTLDNIDWDNDSINIMQSKTGEELRIPLTTSVGNALWDYITSQRPRSVKKEILVSDRHPFIQLPALWHHIKKVFNDAGVRKECGMTGVRIFRHHLATSLLANETEAPVVSSILGHKDPNSLSPYVDADIEHLRVCALSVEKYPVAEEAFKL